jgi:hypothetical protein
LDRDIFDDKNRLNYIDKLRQKTLLKLDEILGEDKTKEISVIEQWFLDNMKPKKLHGYDSFESVYDRDFEQTCFLLSKHTNKDPKMLTVTEYFTIIAYLKNNKPKT